MTFDKSKPYMIHMHEDAGTTWEQDGKFYTTQGEPIGEETKQVTEPVIVSEEEAVPAKSAEIPAGFKKGKFGRLVPV